MKVYRSINNNIISAYDDGGQEVIVVGKGIGFKAREGAPVDPASVQKVFRMSTQNETERLKELFASLPHEYIELTDEILSYAKSVLGKKLHEGAYITLADHISFAVQRHRQGLSFHNVLHTEIRRFYAQEYAIGVHALELMEQRLDVRLPEDEAASIALHVFNAEYDISVGEAFHATRLLDTLLRLVTRETGSVIDEQNYYCERFVTHLKYLAQRIVKKEPAPEPDPRIGEFYRMMAACYPAETACAEKLAEGIRQEYGYPLSKEEVVSLATHIRRIGIQRT